MKYDITFSCGHEGCVDIIGKNRDRESKLEYFRTAGLCPECYKKRMRELEKAQGLICNVRMDIYARDNQCISLVFAGDAYGHKDELKAGGCRYDEGYPAKGIFGSLLNDRRAWHKEVTLGKMVEALEWAESIGANVINEISEVELLARVESEKIQNEKIAQLGPKPQRPECIQGHRWNGKIYSGNRVYLDNKETTLTDDQAAEVKKYLADMASYSSKKQELGLA